MGWSQVEGSVYGREVIGSSLLKAELRLIVRLLFGSESRRLPMVVRGASPSFKRLLGDTRDDSRRFVVYQRFTQEKFLESFQRAHQDVSSAWWSSLLYLSLSISG